MRRIAILFGIFVVVVVGALNYFDARYPNALRIVPPGAVVPASSPETATAADPASTSGSGSKAIAQAPAARVPLEDLDYQGLYPGAQVDRIVYGARPYVDMTVVSVSAQNVVLRNDREIVSIPTGSLPPDLREMAVAYLNGSDKAPSARTGSPAFPSPAPAAPQPTPPIPPATTGVEPSAQNPGPDFEALAWQAARDRAERWLRFERKRRATDIVPLLTGVDLKTPLPMSGLPGYWKVRGRGYVATYQSEKGGTFHDFEITVVLDSKGGVLRADIELL